MRLANLYLLLDDTPTPHSPITTPSRPPRPDADPDLQAIIDSLRAQVAALTTENGTLRTEVDEVRAENETLQGRIVTLDEHLEDANQRADAERETRLAGQQGIANWLAEQPKN